jgi:N6-adenosine-specific RNA methylase IME4
MHTSIPFPDKKYSVIYVDSPWSYDDKMSGHAVEVDGLFGKDVARTADHGFSLGHEYETQSLEWIQSLPLKDIAAKDCVCFSWVVSPLLPEGIATLQKWGFKFKTIAFVWNKLYHNSDKEVAAPGRWTMGNVELCLMGGRGKPKRVCKNVRQLVTAERSAVHSEKPHEVRERIVRLMGDVPRIELFARKRYRGWGRVGQSGGRGIRGPSPTVDGLERQRQFLVLANVPEEDPGAVG